MKLQCSVEVSSRLLASNNLAGRRKSQRGCLSIARQSAKTNELFLILHTTGNKQGTKYKVDGNIEKVFTKFASDGKATIRIKEPPHDLIIKCEALQLKSFLHILKLGISKQVDAAILSISNTNPKSIVVPKTRVVVKTKAEYPVLEGFPRTTEALYISGLERKSFDRQILRLQSLRILDLSNNRISSLPEEIGSLPNLTELHLGSNCLGKGGATKWSWIEGSGVRSNLRLLDLSGNGLSTLPNSIQKLKFLVTLNLGDNSLSALPNGIGNLLALKYLELQKNNIALFPGNMLRLRLSYVDVSQNSLVSGPSCEITGSKVPRLIAVAGRMVLLSRIHYDANEIPMCLVRYLDEATICPCGSPCFESFARKVQTYPLNRISASVKTSDRPAVPFECSFCSLQCLRYH